MEETVEKIQLKYDRFSQFEDEYYDFCIQNKDHTFERDSNGIITILPKSGALKGNMNSNLSYEIAIWNRDKKSGVCFASSTTYILPNKAVRKADLTWMNNQKWNKLTSEQQTKFPPICPDFVLELMSNTDNLKTAQNKMKNEWIANGCKLGWLINPKTETTYIYRENGEMVIVNGFDKKLSGENVLVGFELDLNILK